MALPKFLQTCAEDFETFVLDVIFERRRGKRANLMRAFLTALSHLFAAGVQLRLWCYRMRLLRYRTLGCLVVSVGNLTVGGTGKTPVVEKFARALAQRGRRVAILSRGYKSAKRPLLERLIIKFTGLEKLTPPRVVSDGESLLLDSHQSGDEPYMLASNLKNVIVLVDKDRVKAGKYAIEKLRADTLLLDDGFQYLHLKSRLNLVLIDRTNPWGTGHMLPRGTLREPIRNLKRASYVFITKCDGSDIGPLRDQIRALNPTAEIIECAHHPLYLQDVFTGERKPLEFLRDLDIASLSGIAAPEGFEESLEKLGGSLVCSHRFADHHRYSQQEIIDVINRSHKSGAKAIITTEKDAVRFPLVERRDVPIYFMRVEIEILRGAKDFDDAVGRICFS
jgi:tetraacyldisaccharide 4'-kinase